MFDTVVLLVSLAEIGLVGLGFSPGYVRVFRLARVARSLRVIRLARFTSLVSRLRLLTLAIVHCKTMLMWAVLLLGMVMFFFSIIFLSAVAGYIDEADKTDEHIDSMRVFFGSLSMTMLTLFMAVAGGIDWWDVVRLLLEINIIYVLLFVAFVIFTVLAAMNVISAIFVNDAMETASQDTDLRLKGEVDQTRQMVDSLNQLFYGMSTDGENITAAEFVPQMEGEDMKLFCSSLGLHFTDGESLFKLLDADDSGELNIEEFVIGFLRLRGGSILIDMEVLIQETKSMIRAASSDSKKMLDELKSHVRAVMEKLEINAP